MEVRIGGHVGSVDSMNIRQIGQSTLIYVIDGDYRPPEINLGPDGLPAEGETIPNILRPVSNETSVRV
jgi:hypothetical protein